MALLGPSRWPYTPFHITSTSFLAMPLYSLGVVLFLLFPALPATAQQGTALNPPTQPSQKRKPPSKLPLISLTVLVLVLLLAVYVAYRLYLRHHKRHLAHSVRLNAGKRAAEVDHLDMGLAMGAGGESRCADRSSRAGPHSANGAVSFDVDSEVEERCFDPVAALAEEQRKRRERRRRAAHSPTSAEGDENMEPHSEDSGDGEEADHQNALIFVNIAAAKERLEEKQVGSPCLGGLEHSTLHFPEEEPLVEGSEKGSPRFGAETTEDEEYEYEYEEEEEVETEGVV